MRKVIAAILALPMVIITACGSEREPKAEENSENNNTSEKSPKSGNHKIQKLKDLGLYTESRMRPGSECDGIPRECFSK
ncbi:MAG: hypothetical protein RJB13_2576 [Pseudomonadota bacterium]|jgi:hypothetical protein